MSNLQANINRNYSKNGIEVKFNESTSYQVDTMLKSLGFRFSRNKNLWYAIYSDSLNVKLNEKFKVNGISIKGEPEVSEAEKQELIRKQEAQKALKLEEAKAKYEGSTNAMLAVLPYSDFVSKSASYTGYQVKGFAEPFSRDAKTKEFLNLPKGRKRPDKYSASHFLALLQNEALENGMIIPLKNYYGNPYRSLGSSADSLLSDLKRLITKYPQQKNAVDYDDFYTQLLKKDAEQKRIAELWHSYRKKYVYIHRIAYFKDEGKIRQVTINKDGGFFSLSPTNAGLISITYSQGWMSTVLTTPLNDIYIENPNVNPFAKSILELHPFREEEFEAIAGDSKRLKIAQAKLKLAKARLNLALI